MPHGTPERIHVVVLQKMIACWCWRRAAETGSNSLSLKEDFALQTAAC